MISYKEKLSIKSEELMKTVKNGSGSFLFQSNNVTKISEISCETVPLKTTHFYTADGIHLDNTYHRSVLLLFYLFLCLHTYLSESWIVIVLMSTVQSCSLNLQYICPLELKYSKSSGVIVTHTQIVIIYLNSQTVRMIMAWRATCCA
jgi:hypothetical protein